ncbi:hypothetical protein BJV82DRAFT_72587 [Fennellomyces sp. T-0311]|nr:hypothetical protein BJV82DRAFT_72587 [Fennellomyces sp. T-0311]
MAEIKDYYESIDIHIRWADGPDLIVAVSPIHDSIETLKQKIRQSVPTRTQNKNIRLIYQGRILADNRELSFYGIGKRVSKEAAPVYVHCSISEYVSRPSGQAQQEEQVQ